jgi:hypothetical protein
MEQYQFYILAFAIILLIVVGVRQSIKKARKRVEETAVTRKDKEIPSKPKLTEEQFQKAWNSFSYLLLLAAVGSLYVGYTAVKAAILPVNSGIAWVYWIDAGFSFAAAISAILIFFKKTKSMVFLYFGFMLVPILLFMSTNNDQNPSAFKINALIHLFPLVLLYFVLKPVWDSMKN